MTLDRIVELEKKLGTVDVALPKILAPDCSVAGCDGAEPVTDWPGLAGIRAISGTALKVAATVLDDAALVTGRIELWAD